MQFAECPLGSVALKLGEPAKAIAWGPSGPTAAARTAIVQLAVIDRSRDDGVVEPAGAR